MANGCVFCKIIEGEIPANRIYEDDEVLAFLDINQTTRGHTLVVPKKHTDHFLNTPKLTVNRVMGVAQRIGQAQIQSLGAKGVNVLTNVLKAAGQSVFHFHVHVIPRYFPDDRLRIEMMENKEKHQLNLPMLAQSLKDYLDNE
jgi:histidine triad (HIT) family protein